MDDDDVDLSTHFNEEQTYRGTVTSAGGSLVGARRMLFEKQIQLPNNIAKDENPTARASRSNVIRDNTYFTATDGKQHSRVSIRTLQLNDRTAREASPPPERESKLPCLVPLRPPSPSLLNDPAFAKRVSYHHAVFKSPELILPASLLQISAPEEDVSFPAEPVPAQEQSSEEAAYHQVLLDVLLKTPCPNSVLITSQDLSSAKDNDRISSLSSSRNIRESIFVDAALSESNANDVDEDDKSKFAQIVVKSDAVNYPEELNPFSDKDEQESADINKPGNDSSSYNPFGSESEEEGDENKNGLYSKTGEFAKSTNTNPFWSGSENEDEEEENKKRDEPNQSGRLLENEYRSIKRPIPLPR